MTARGSLRGGLRDLIVACRPLQWQRNGLLYAGFIFSAGAAWSWRDPDTWVPLLLTTTGAMLLFNAVASGQYLINDVLDEERDRLHPRKRLRPIAAGRIPARSASVWGAGLVLAGVLGGLAISIEFALVAAGYASLTLAYSFGLKRLVIVDLVAVAAGFTLRAAAGAVAIAVPISPWLLVCTTLGALFIAVAKRRQELLLLGVQAQRHRAVLGAYPLAALDAMLAAAAAATIAAYTLYAVLAEHLPRNHTMLLTLPFVLFGVLRYRLVAAQSPERYADDLLSRDRPLLATVILFAATALVVMAVGR